MSAPFDIQSIETGVSFRKPLSERLVSAGNTLSRKVVDHCFYLEMVEGVLCPDRFSQFIIQDILYLQERLKVLEIAQRRFSNHAFLFSALSGGDQEELEKFNAFRSHFNICIPVDHMNLACRNYVTFLNETVKSKSLEEFIASLLSCLWTFQRIAFIHADRADDLDGDHFYFHFLKDLKGNLTSSSKQKLLLILYTEINSKSLEEHFIHKVIEVFLCGIQHEIKFLDSFYE